MQAFFICQYIFYCVTNRVLENSYLKKYKNIDVYNCKLYIEVKHALPFHSHKTRRYTLPYFETDIFV